MKTSVIICEFNPFHKGHKKLFDMAKENGTDRIVCVMSGNFTERGEIAVADKFTRARAAVSSGADLVIELPFPFCSSSAEYFAHAGVYIADRIGFADELVFGSEVGDIDELAGTAEGMMSKEFRELSAALHKDGIGYAAASSLAYEKLYGKSELLSRPNNILALEYMKAIKKLGSSLTPVTFKREDNYNSEELKGAYPSASALKKLIRDDRRSASMEGIPEDAAICFEEAIENGYFPMSYEKFGFAVLSKLKLSDKDSLEGINGASGGLGNRLLKMAASAHSYEELLQNAATKKYTVARIRRTLLFAALGVLESDMKLPIFYSNLLAISEDGRALLAKHRKSKGLPLVTKVSERKAVIRSLNEKERAQAEGMCELDRRADVLFELCRPD